MILGDRNVEFPFRLFYLPKLNIWDTIKYLLRHFFCFKMLVALLCRNHPINVIKTLFIKKETEVH